MSQEFAQTSSQEKQLFATIFNVFRRGDVGHEVGPCRVPRAGRTISPRMRNAPLPGRQWGVGVGRVTLGEEVLARDERHSILLASGYNKPKTEPRPDQSHACDTRPIWTPWGWAVDLPRLKWLILHWCFRNRKCFTCPFRARYRRTRREVFPILSRVQKIGYELGENGRTPAWYRANHRTE